MSRSSHDVSQLIDEKEKEKSESLKSQYTIAEEINILDQKILTLRKEKKELEMTKMKADHNVRQIAIELNLLKTEFWTAKESGL